MLVLGLQGSPRKKGNTHHLLSAVLKSAQELGARTMLLDVTKRRIDPCEAYTVCEKKGFCPIKDDMQQEVYGLLRQAEVIVAATPVFFYNMTAQLKALVDRCQVLWARKYLLKLKDPLAHTRRGLLLSVGATRGNNLFEAIELSCRYFFDAVDADYTGSLCYRGIEKIGAFKQHPTITDDVQSTVTNLLNPLLGRRRVLVLGHWDTCRSQLAAAFLQQKASHKLDIVSAGLHAGDTISPLVLKAARMTGLDLAFRSTQTLEAVLTWFKPDKIIAIGDEAAAWADQSQDSIIIWDEHLPDDPDLDAMVTVRDKIEKRAVNFLNDIL